MEEHSRRNQTQPSMYSKQPRYIPPHRTRRLFISKCIHKGTSSEFGPEFLMTKNVILVTINYRLGVYGFLNTVNSSTAKDNQMFGNMGFKDQVLALKWVQHHIVYFGGDPNKVTLSGQSAGAMSAHLHLLSPQSVGLFQQAILMSSSSLTAKINAANNTATPLAEHLGLDTSNFDAIMEGLRAASHEDLFKAAKGLGWFNYRLNTAGLACLVIERPGPDSFMTEYPLNIIRNGNFKQIPLFFGNTNREGLFIYGRTNINSNLQNLEDHIPFFFTNKDEVKNKISKFYNLHSTKDLSDRIEFYTYAWYKYSVFRAAREHARTQSNVYYYQFECVGDLNYQKNKMPQIHDLCGACHADDLGYLYMSSGKPTRGSIEEQIMRNEVSIWVNFISNGEPIRSLKMFKEDDHNFINISNSGLKIGTINEESFDFWDKLYRDYSSGPY